MKKPTVFVIMPFTDLYIKFFEYLKIELVDKMNITNANTDNMVNILSDVIIGINDADYIIADISELNANVYYELGIAHALNRKVIMISQNLNDLPFDIKTYRVLEYSFHVMDAPKIVEKLSKIILAERETIKFSNPVKDIIERDSANNGGMLKKKEAKYVVAPYPEEKGFMDYICELEEDTKNLTSSFKYITKEMSIMSKNIEDKTTELNQIKARTKNSFLIKSKTGEAASDINKFSKELKSFNLRYDVLWTKIYLSYTRLLDNKIVGKEADKNNFDESLAMFVELQASMRTVKTSFEEFKQAADSLSGVEQKLSYASREVSGDIQNFIDLIKISISSIDKIIAKHQIIFNIN